VRAALARPGSRKAELSVVTAEIVASRGLELPGFTSRSLHDMQGRENAMMRDYFETER
jgi:hypothetical protein